MASSEWSTPIQEEDDAEEQEQRPEWVLSALQSWHSVISTVTTAWRRRGAVKEFLKAVKEVRLLWVHAAVGSQQYRYHM